MSVFAFHPLGYSAVNLTRESLPVQKLTGPLRVLVEATWRETGTFLIFFNQYFEQFVFIVWKDLFIVL